MKSKRILNYVYDFIIILGGCALYGTGLNIFLVPNRLVLGGVTGLSTVINYIFPFLSIGMLVLVFNIPLLFFSYRLFGREFFFKTLVANLTFVFFLDIFSFLPAYNHDPLLAALFGAILCGMGLGIIYMRGMVTGGTDIIARIIKYFKPHFPLGQLLFFTDMAVVLFAGVIFKDITNMLFSIIAIYIASKLIDTVLIGLDTAKTAIIVSSEGDRIQKAIIDGLDKTATALTGSGAYSKGKTDVLICVIRRHELFKLKSIIHETDEKAFFIVLEAKEVFGEGYKGLK